MLEVLHGDALRKLAEVESESVQTCVTSPPYWGLRDYGVDGQLGLEKTPEEYVERLVEIFREVRRVLHADGTLWLNLGDSYTANRSYQVSDSKWTDVGNTKASTVPKGLKPKDLVGIPWMVAFALRADGWYLRSDIIWSKPNPMPESVADRPTKSHEYIFLLAKSQKYFFDAEAVKEPTSSASDFGNPRPSRPMPSSFGPHRSRLGSGSVGDSSGRNIRSVWTVTTQPFGGAHFATFPPDLIKPCILAGAPIGGVVLDPFAGSGTTGKVAIELGRKAILIEPKAEYVEMIERRCRTTIGLPLSA